ncbi:P-loop containing nucleoside triphosphate hydrolase protein [Polychytrium aggregatum]|uniref:P-loop containing nucleoside triphosphate hydrolase protein n=1 Tax=Polychytrium aggregatum TaxID=110093 RepID=UPI0022FF1DD5|nr:P-loop containing nucleoside triphosphate hydrolase protein [Polychytrium aggregatum]KAI9203285.1 P-loop containing nucleoside triphosphate hydrolase protein [Polychytrium aggregatum]
MSFLQASAKPASAISTRLAASGSSHHLLSCGPPRMHVLQLTRTHNPWQRVRFSSSGTSSSPKPGSPGFWRELRRIALLARPEALPLTGAVLLLSVSSAVTMSVPFSMGKIIDLVLEGLKEEQSAKSTDSGLPDPAQSQAVAAAEPTKPQDVKGPSNPLGAILERPDPESQSTERVSLPLIFGGLLAVFAVGAAANTGRVILMRLTGEKIVFSLRRRLFQNIMKQDIAFFDRNQGGELVSRLSSDSLIVGRTVTNNLSDGLRSLAMSTMGVGMMAYINLKLTMIMMMIVPPVALSAVWYGRIVRDLSKKTQDAVSEATKVSTERFGNVRTVRAFAQEHREIDLYTDKARAIYNLARREATASGFFFGGTGFAGNAVMLALLYYGGSMVTSGAITVGELTSFFLYTAYVGGSMIGISGVYSDLMKGVGASSRLFNLLDTKAEIESLPSKGLQLDPDRVKGHIQLRNIAFTYPTRSDVQIFKDLSFEVEAGTSVAIVGHSGSGKSTVAQLILRFYDPSTGSVTIDGKDVKDLDVAWLRDNLIGFVSQEPVLFAATIRDNIAYGRPSASLEDIQSAAEQANAREFIESFPDGFDTFVGEKGYALSGGQKQRIAIARALLKNPKILVLDEATSALDATSEYLVSDALDRLVEGRTVITIAHRLSTIMKADKIIMLESGQVAEQGSFAELMNIPNGKFRELVQRQLGDAVEDDD